MARNDLNIWFILMVIGQVSPISYNTPKFCPNTTWNPNATTIANISTIGSSPQDIFINTNNTIYVPNISSKKILLWSGNNLTLAGNISINSPNLYGLFITETDDIYVGIANSFYGIDKLPSNSTNFTQIMYTCQLCFDVFIDVGNNIYCSMNYYHQVVKKSLDTASNTLTAVAGIAGSSGSTSTMLNFPLGIFVDVNFDLYVADFYNNRIQLFHFGELSAITVAGNGSSTHTISLDHPIGIVLDADKYLFIVDQYNNRIVGSSANGFRCIVGCSGSSGAASNTLNYPVTMAFDSYGNIYVVDQNNNRIQKFILSTNICNETTLTGTTTSTISNVLLLSTEATANIIETPMNVTSYNQPKLQVPANWNPDGTTFATSITVGRSPCGIFINTNNTIYVADQAGGRIQVWLNGSVNPTTTISGNLSYPYAVFVTSNGDIYTGNSYSSNGVDKRQLNSNSTTVVMFVNYPCYGLFVDIANNLYCSLRDLNQVVKKPVNSASNISMIVAGSTCSAPLSNTLNKPYGIFVDINFNLYVADCGNDRIQLFSPNQLNGKTIASNSTTGTISLDCPTGIVLDANNYLYIVDQNNHRIVGSGPSGFRCIVGCYSYGSASNLLYYPQTMAFDSYGNIYVTDRNNSRIQKFVLLNNTYALSYNAPKFCPSTTWDPNGTTIVNQSIIGAYPIGIYIDTNNTLYLTSKQYGNVGIWFNDSLQSTKNLSRSPSNAYAIFVTSNGDIFVSSQDGNNQYIDKLTLNSSNSTLVSTTTYTCYGLFVDIVNNLYCSMGYYDCVQKKPLNSNSSTWVTVAGTAGSAGSTSTMLNWPYGIFVDVNFDLYVADCDNNRVQLFHFGELSAITVAGNGSSNTTILLHWPTGIVLDADKYLFIVDEYNNRIVGSSANGFRCIVGCSGSQGSTSDKLNYPFSIAFDSYGNIYVVDQNNNRSQKYILQDNSCATTASIQATSSAASVTSSLEMTSTMIMTTSKSSVINDTCYSPIVTLIPGASTLSKPTPFRRSQDFHIISLIELNCNDSFWIKTQWIIKNCTSVCSNSLQLDETISTTFSELYIPARTLPYGVYQLELFVTIIGSSQSTISKSVYVEMNPSGITANLVQLGTSMITNGHGNDLLLDPGSFSIDPDANVFNSSQWIYKYYCRIYGLYNFPISQSVLLTIDDRRSDPSNPSCLSNRTGFKFGNSINSSLTILANSLQSNRTYQFMVQMENIKNSSLQATGYVLVKVEDTHSQLIAIGCVIGTMCVPNLEYQLLNPTTQVALFALCIGNCLSIENVTWNIYSGSMNSSANYSQWTLFNQTNSLESIWFFGINTSNFTATNQLFLSNPHIQLWRFEVVYSFPTEISRSALNFLINQPPANGICSISPLNGTTSTVFTITCPNWSDVDGIKDYSFYTWTRDLSKRTMIGFSPVSQSQLQLPAGDDQTSQLNIIVMIRDELDCITEFNLSSVYVQPDLQGINSLISTFQTSSTDMTKNPIIQLLVTGNQNRIGQILTSVSQEFNEMNRKSIDQAASNGVAATSISISPLGSEPLSGIITTTQTNQSTLNEFNKDLNSLASIREYLLSFTTNLQVTTMNSIILQSSTLAQLTGATNQLTRTSLTNAANKCSQLSFALYSISTEIAYEDAQMAATQLIQCGTNLLTAVNGPLQERTLVLDSDLSSASAVPEYYDTDLESVWSNLNLFVDGNDFSSQSIDKSRNLYYQKQTANQINNQLTEMISLLTSVLNIHLNIGQNFTINTSEAFMSLETRRVQSLANKEMKQVGVATIRLPMNMNLNRSDDSTVSIRSIMKPLAAFGNSKSSSNTNLSTSVSLSIVDQNGNEVPVQTNDTHPIEIIIPRDPNLVVPSMIVQNVTSTNSTAHQQLFQYHYVNLSDTNSVSVHLEIHPFDSNLSYLLIYKFDQIPQLNQSIYQLDGWTILCPSNLSNESIYTDFLDNQLTQNHQSLVFGLRELNSTESNIYCSNFTVRNPPITNQRCNFTSNYALRIYTSGCYYLDEKNQWNSQGLRVGSLTNHQQTQCFSTHLTTFAGGFLVLPESVNWQYVFANADFMSNKTIYLTVICVSIIYLLLLIYARYKDKKDLEKLGVTPLPDNHSSDRYYYQILVFTGHRKDAGTKSKVQFVLAGDEDETHVRTLADPKRKILQRGGIDAFIMSVPKSLGPLNYIRIWHDNSGSGASSSWFLKYIIVRDLQTMEKSHFFAQRWFAVEKEDGKIERTLPVAGILETSQFSYVLSKQAYHSISDGHLWFSIFSRPASNIFSRVQRCTCCFVLLFFSMFLNIMYYDLKKDADLKNSTMASGLTLGPLFITSEQIGIGIIVDILAFIPSLLLVQIFRRLRPRRPFVSSLRQTIYKLKANVEIQNEMGMRLKTSLSFPWWFIFVGYGLCIILVGLSILFIIARGIEFGDVKTQQWLVSIVTGFFSSIFLTQPLKILTLAMIFVFLCHKSDDDKEAHEYLDDEYLHAQIEPLFTYRQLTQINRLNEGEIAFARSQRLREIHMWSILREALTYICFLCLILIITYSNRTTDSFYQVDHLRKYLKNSPERIRTINDYWKWLEESFVENLRAQNWYNNGTPRYLTGYLNDKTNRLIGWGMMRQIRVQSDSCSYEKLNSSCYTGKEETNSFEIKWTNVTSKKGNTTIERAFQYASADELESYAIVGDYGKYSGGGYVYEFRGRLRDMQSNLSMLHQLGWIDLQTRAIVIQFSLYNPNVELLTSVILLSEFVSSGYISSEIRIAPMNFFFSLTSISQLICLILYMMFILYFMFIEIKALFHLKFEYFRQFWCLIELGIIICSWMAVGIYICRSHEYSRIGQLFQQRKGYSSINLQYSSYLNDFLTFIYGFCCFFGTIKLIRLFRFNRRLYLFIRVLRNCAEELISFALMFSIVFFAFICLFYFLFHSKVESCSSLFHTITMLFQMVLMQFDACALIDASTFLGPFCFSLFILIVVFVCMSMFLAIVNENFKQTRDNLKKSDDEKIYSFMFDRFLRWTGLRKATKEEVHEAYDAIMRTQYYDPIEHFPDKIDQLLDGLNRIYMTQVDNRNTI